MFRLSALIYALVGPTLAGSLIVACLATGLDTLRPILIAALVGFAAAVPIARVIAGRIVERDR